MIDKIRSILKQANIDIWNIRELSTSSRELFFIRKDLDMNRAKKVRSYTLTVYRDFQDEGNSCKGSATLKLTPSMDESEIRAKVEKAYYAASFVKNPFYPLPSPGKTERNGQQEKSHDFQKSLDDLSGLTKSLYKNDVHELGGINSAEIFLSSNSYRILNSEGIDVSYSKNRKDIELICDWKEEGADVELYNMFSFSDNCPELVEEECRKQIEHCRLRAQASPATELKSVNVILGGNAIIDLMGFYLSQTTAKNKYEKLSSAEKGKVFQGDNVRGDLISLTLDPAIPGSSYASPFDTDGISLKQIPLLEKGVVRQFHGSLQYSHYLNIPPTGKIKSFTVARGDGRFEELKKEPYVEILTFSDFQMDNLTGDFGGEIRLALYFDGKKVSPITGATLSACLFDIQDEIYLSGDIIRKENYQGPKSLMFKNGHIAGS
ncbi:MAG: hypothetical protein B6241_13525 [Spirochaetaceae bacterium 4572_59]|nr:MAG: hypothetical protein B6241_13525 [Spirochaetaceae bacterium 4572_59]